MCVGFCLGVCICICMCLFVFFFVFWCVLGFFFVHLPSYCCCCYGRGFLCNSCFLMFNIFYCFLFFLCVYSMTNAVNKLRGENPFNFHRCSLCIVLIGSFWKCWPWVRVSQHWFAGPPSRHSTWPQNITWMYRCFRAASITHFYASPTLLHCVLEKVVFLIKILLIVFY